MDLVETPCLGICLIDPEDGLCAGCARSLDEIARWSSMSDAERRAIMEALSDRRPRRRKGGRAARIRAMTAGQDGAKRQSLAHDLQPSRGREDGAKARRASRLSTCARNASTEEDVGEG